NFWLHELSRDPYLRERTFGIALEACSTCTDRATLGWNSMQIARLLHHVEMRPNGISPQEFLTLARQIFYIQQIEIAAADKVKMLPDIPDAIEVYLNLFCRLKERLGLPDKFAGN
ncbi:NEL-type E3 ubiquitin ligase domain-containing protein, partial [Escherichia coli]